MQQVEDWRALPVRNPIPLEAVRLCYHLRLAHVRTARDRLRCGDRCPFAHDDEDRTSDIADLKTKPARS